MKSQLLRNLPAIIAILLIGISGCTKETVDVEFKNIQGELATFEVHNYSDEAIYSIAFEIEFYQDDQLLLTDTVTYRMQDSTPYARARQTTMFAQRAPDGANNADVRVISINK